MNMKRGTASKRLSLDLSVENNYLNFLGRGSYFFAFLSIIRTSLTTNLRLLRPLLLGIKINKRECVGLRTEDDHILYKTKIQIIIMMPLK